MVRGLPVTLFEICQRKAWANFAKRFPRLPGLRQMKFTIWITILRWLIAIAGDLITPAGLAVGVTEIAVQPRAEPLRHWCNGRQVTVTNQMQGQRGILRI